MALTFLRFFLAMEEEDLSMQIGWNQLFQQFVSDLFVDTEERNAPVVTIDNLDKSGRGIGNVLHTLSQAVDFVRTKYARRFSPYVDPLFYYLIDIL